MVMTPLGEEAGLRLPPLRQVGAALLRWLWRTLRVLYALSPGALALAGWTLRRVGALVVWRGWIDVVALAFLGGLVLYYFRDAILHGRIFFESDTSAFYYPLTSRYDQALASGELLLWTRAIFAGFPLFADSETGMLYPVNVLLLNARSFWDAFVWQRVVNFILGAWFMYAFGRALGFRPFSAAIASLVFTFGSFLVAQQHHANIIGSTVWLPAVFFCVEMALQSWGRRRFQWFALGGLALGVQCLAVHVQIVLMTLLALGLYLGFRWLMGPVAVRLRALPDVWASSPLRRLLVANVNVLGTLLHRTMGLGVAFTLVIGVGLGIGAVQLLPLYELAQYSYRGVRVAYGFATTYAMPPSGVLQLIQPYRFLTGAPGGQVLPSWETALYVGIPTLVLAAIGLLFAPDRRVWFFGILALLGVLLAMGANAPWDLHRRLWELPGFSAVRAPGRFTLLTVFALAAMAGWGAHWLDLRLRTAGKVREGEGRLALLGGGSFGLFLGLLTMLPLALILALQLGRAWMDAYKSEALEWLGYGASMLTTPDATNQAERLFQAVRKGLEITNPQMALSVLLLQATVALLALWQGTPRLGFLAKGALLGVLAVDLLSFGSSLHPLISRDDLAQRPSAAVYLDAAQQTEDRVVAKYRLSALESNQLMPLGVSTLGGYSSLPPQRHLEYLALLRGGWDNFPDVLVDAAGVRYIAVNSRFQGFPFYNSVSFDPVWPITLGNRNNPGALVTFDGGLGQGDTLGVIAALRYGMDIPQGATLAEITVVTDKGERKTVTLQAGQHVAEWAYDRADVVGKVKHGKAPVAFSLQATDDDELSYKVNLSYAELPLTKAMTARTVEYRYFYPVGSLRLYGMSIFDKKTGLGSQVRKKMKYRAVYQDSDTVIYENTSPLPRAYVVPQGVELPSSSKVLYQMLEGTFNPRQMVILEDPARAGLPKERLVSDVPVVNTADKAGMTPARLVSYSSAEAKLEYETTTDGYLVLSDSYYPGWEAYLDGSPTPIYRANYLFRAVQAPAGRHQVEFRYNPMSFRVGLGVTLLSLLMVGVVLVAPEGWALTRLLARGLARKRGVLAGVGKRVLLRLKRG